MRVRSDKKPQVSELVDLWARGELNSDGVPTLESRHVTDGLETEHGVSGQGTHQRSPSLLVRRGPFAARLLDAKRLPPPGFLA